MPVSIRLVPVPVTPSTETVSGAPFHSGSPPTLVPLGASFTNAKLCVRAGVIPRWMPSRVTT